MPLPVGVASTDVQAGTGSAVWDEAGESQNENGMSCANSNVNGMTDNGPGFLGVDLADLNQLTNSRLVPHPSW